MSFAGAHEGPSAKQLWTMPRKGLASELLGLLLAPCFKHSGEYFFLHLLLLCAHDMQKSGFPEWMQLRANYTQLDQSSVCYLPLEAGHRMCWHIRRLMEVRHYTSRGRPC